MPQVANNQNFGGPNAQQAANANAALGIKPTVPTYQNATTDSTGSPIIYPTYQSTPAQNTSQPQATYQGQDGQTYNNATNQPTTLPPVLTANVLTPTNYGNNQAPAVFNASKATSYLGNVGTQIGALNNDSAAQSQTQAINSQAQGQQQAQSQTQGQTQTQGQSDTTDPAAQLNDQISSILANLGQGEQNLDTQLNSATTTNNEGQQVTFAQAEQENQMQQVQQYQQYAGLLNQIQTGTYPLSAPEQQLLSSTQSSFMQAIQQQQIANQAYTGQIAEAMASLGINTSAPTQAMGNIFGAISTGQSKIAALDTQMAQSVSQLQLSFQQQDFSQVQTEWQNMSKQFSDRQDALASMQKQVSDALTQQKSDMVDYAKTAISALQSVATMSYQEKQDVIKNTLNQAQFTEQQRHDIVTEQQDQEKINLQQQLQSGTTSSGTTATVPMTGNGTPDSAGQAQFLENLPGGPTGAVAADIKGLADYSLNPANFTTSAKAAQGGLTRGDLVTLAKQYDPTYDDTQFAARQTLVKSITSGPYSQTINSANTLVQHLAKFQQAAAAIDKTGGPVPLLNSVTNSIYSATGNPNVNNFNTEADAIASEAAKIYKGTGATSQDEIDSWKSSLSPNASPAQHAAAIQTIVGLMAGKLSTLSSQYQGTMGKTGTFQILTPASMKVLTSLGIDPTTVDPNASYTLQSQALDQAAGSGNGAQTQQSSLDSIGSQFGI